ncbi:MAG: hypothetical protein WCA20_09505 [Candidatus Sulfotelmatobacter sp.]
MSSRQIDLKEVPGIDIVQERLASIDPACPFLLRVMTLIAHCMFWN